MKHLMKQLLTMQSVYNNNLFERNDNDRGHVYWLINKLALDKKDLLKAYTTMIIEEVF